MVLKCKQVCHLQAVVFSLSLSLDDKFFGFIFDFVLAFLNHMYTIVGFFLLLRFIVVLWFLSFDRLRFCLSCSTSISSFGCSMWRVQCTHTNNHQMCQYLLLELTYSFSCLRIKFVCVLHSNSNSSCRFFPSLLCVRVCVLLAQVFFWLCSVNYTSQELCSLCVQQPFKSRSI